MNKNFIKYIKNFLVLGMAITIIFGSSISVKAQGIDTYASCSHTWSSWQINKTEYKYPPVYGDCDIRVSTWIRACEKCGKTEYKETEYQMTHDWANLSSGGKMCRNCNMTISSARQAIFALQ